MTQIYENLGQELLDRQIKPSYHRMKVLEYLKSNREHPTVDQIFRELQKGLPTLSKATIYNTLNLFIDKRIVRAISIEDNEVRYDIILDNHGHFKCESCGDIYDFHINIDDFQSKELKDFLIKDKNVYFKGKCPKCL
ncbi:MAG TPA: transcriptional repressor [Clostridia bacterium]|nr:transcriptional repressor [Clostridia bacterium]